MQACLFLCSFLLPDSCRLRSEPMSFFQGIKLVMGHGPYAKLVMVFLFTSLGFMVRIESVTHMTVQSQRDDLVSMKLSFLFIPSQCIKYSRWYVAPLQSGRVDRSTGNELLWMGPAAKCNLLYQSIWWSVHYIYNIITAIRHPFSAGYNLQTSNSCFLQCKWSLVT